MRAVQYASNVQLEEHLRGARVDFWSRFKKLFRRHRAERREVRLPVDLQRVWGDPHEEKWRSVDLEAKGVTRDLSASGVYFETDSRLVEGSMIRFMIDLDTPIQGENARLECHGYIVRVEGRGTGRVGIAVRLDEQHVITAKR